MQNFSVPQKQTLVKPLPVPKNLLFDRVITEGLPDEIRALSRDKNFSCSPGKEKRMDSPVGRKQELVS